MKICIVGGGSTYTPELIEGFINIAKRVPIGEIVMLDIPASREKFDIVAGLAQRMIARSNTSIKLTATLNAEEAFDGADYIINQFRAGLMKGRINDELTPLEFDLIGQETTGMGGMACALRAMPILERYVELARRFSNDAMMINFSNPSGLLTEFLLNYVHHEKCIGLCNVPIKFLIELAKSFGVERDQVFLRYYGLNHLSWTDAVAIAGDDRTQQLWDLFRTNMKNVPETEYEPDFLQELRLLPNPYLRYYYMPDRMLLSEVEDRDSKGCRGQVVLKVEDELLALYRQPELREKPKQLAQRGGFMYSTVATELIRDIETDAGAMHIINTRNDGAVDDFPDDYVLEIPAQIHKAEQKSIEMGQASKIVTGLVHTIKAFERLTIEGYLNRDENAIKMAMLIHPLGPNESQLDALWSRLKQVNAGSFPEF